MRRVGRNDDDDDELQCQPTTCRTRAHSRNGTMRRLISRMFSQVRKYFLSGHVRLKTKQKYATN